jgi:hypothetical protein
MAMLLPADTLILRSGASFDGAFVGGDNHSVRFLVGDRVNTYRLSDVDTINFGPSQQSSNAAPSGPPPDPSYQQSGPSDANPYTNNSAPPAYAGNTPPPQNNGPYQNGPTPSGGGMEIPAGAPLTVRLIDPVNSETDRLGQTYRASIDEPVVVNGYQVIPRGADAVVSLIASQQAGRIQGRTALTLAVRNVTVNGRVYPVTTTGVVQSAGSRSKKSAEVIGGTAALGAVIGAIAGGGTGAAIGAVSGGAVGTAASMGLNSDRVRVPSETRLTFTLQNPLDL